MSRRVEALAIGLAISTLLLGAGWLWAGLRERDGRVREARGQLERGSDMVRAAVDESLEELRAREDERPYYLYHRYYSPPDVLAISDPVALSPLAAEPTDPRVQGYFQIDPGGVLNTPYDGGDLAAIARAQALGEFVQREAFSEIRALAVDESDADGRVPSDASPPVTAGQSAAVADTSTIAPARPRNRRIAREGRTRQRQPNRELAAEPVIERPSEPPEPPEPPVGNSIDNALTGLNRWSNEQAVELARAQQGDVEANSRLVAAGRQVPRVSRRNVDWADLPQTQNLSRSSRPNRAQPSQRRRRPTRQNRASNEAQQQRSSGLDALLGSTLLPSVSSVQSELEAKRAATIACTSGTPVVVRLRLRGSDGRVESADIEELPEGVTGRDCVLAELRQIRVPSFASPTAVVHYRYTADPTLSSVPEIMNPDNFGNLVSRETEVGYTPMRYESDDQGGLFLYRVVTDQDVSVVQGILLEPSHLLASWIPGIVERHDQAAIEVVRAGEGTCAVRSPASEIVDGIELCTPPAILAVATGSLDEELRWQVGVLALLWLIAALAAFAIVVAARRAETLSRQKSAFVSAVSHELRTPLTTLRMHAEMLDEGMVSARRQPKVHKELVRESVRLSRLVENVLSLAKLEEGKRTLRLEDGDLRAHVRSVVEEQRGGVEERGFALDAPASDGSVGARFDAQAVEQIVTNLLDNALKYAAEADDRQIQVRVRRDGDGAQIVVRDRGPGIPEADRERVFERFHRVEREATAHAPGTGIGLALVRELAEAHHGSATAHERAGGGLEIRVRLG